MHILLPTSVLSRILLVPPRLCRSLFLHGLFSLEHDGQSHKRQHDRLEPGVLGQQNGNVTDVGHETDHAAHDVVFAVEKGLAAGIEFRVVCAVVVAFCQELEGWCRSAIHHVSISPSIKTEKRANSPFTTTKPPNNPVHNGDVLALDIIHDDLADLCVHPPVPEE